MTITGKALFVKIIFFLALNCHAEDVNSNKIAQNLNSDSTVEENDENHGLFGDWKGVKTKLINNGFDISLAYKGDYYSIVSGPEEKESGFLGNLDLTFNFDLEKLLGLNGFDFFVYGLGNHGNKPSEKFGDSFVSSNIEAPSTFKIYEAYLKKTFDEEKFVLLFGLRDLNADFYALESSSYLINSSFGVSPLLSQTGVNGPSIFPVTAPAITAKYKSKEHFYFQTGLFNATAGNPDNPKGTHIPMNMKNGNLLIFETGMESYSILKKVSLGLWQYSKQVEAIDQSVEPTYQNYGQYLMLDLAINNEISLFSKFGKASPKVNTFSQSIEAGLVFQSPLNSRPEDTFFIGYSQAEASDDYKAANNSSSYEAVLEAGYKIKVTNGFWITPDYQEVINPGLLGEPNKSSIFILRTNLIF